MKPIFARILVALSLLAPAARAEVILQYFGTSWAEIERRLPELAERGYDSLWLPPPFKGGAGTYSVGFDTFDRFDLGDRDQCGTVRTKYGTKAELLSLMRAAHRFGLRVYFDNVMAHNAGPLDSNTQPGNLFPGIPGFVPEDFHIVRDGTTWRKPADYPNYQDEWQVLNRNPFAWDIAQELPQNVSFNPTGTAEAHTYNKWSGVRHPGKTQWYLDTDLTVATNQSGEAVHPFADKEPYQDIGYVDGGNTVGANNGKFDFKDTNGNGQHDVGELSEPFTDTGVDPTVPWRQNATWGYGDGKYNMGNVVAEDVNAMLFRSVRWFIEEAKPDGFRLDAVKHVPSYFFGKQDGADKSYVNWGYDGQIQEQFNVSHGFTDWGNHRNSIFSSEYDARDDAMLFGEHLGSPPAEGGYLDAGMRIANDNLLNTVKGGIGSSLAGYDQRNYGGWGNQEGSQSVAYVMSHDNNYLYGGDRAAAHAYILTREGLPIIYTDGYNQAGAPDYFPKPAGTNFLGEYNDTSITGAVNVHRDFARGYQVPRWSDQNFVAYERVDNRENKDGGSWNGETMLFMMARNYQGAGQARNVQTGFPVGATLENQSPHGGRFRVYVQNDGTINDSSGNKPVVPSGGWFAFTWHNPIMPKVWQAGAFKEDVPPIQIYQNGTLAPMMDHWRVDGKDGDAGFNPYNMPAGDTATRSYRVKIPRITDGTNLRFLARADGTADNIRMKLDGGVDINSQIPKGPTAGTDLRDFPPGINSDEFDANVVGDRVKQASTDTYVGYEQMNFVRRGAEKFAARNTARNVIGSPGAETYQVTIGTAGVTLNTGGGINSNTDTASWAYHDPDVNNGLSPSVPQFNPAPQSAANQSVALWVKTGYQFQVNKVWVYYTTDGATYPEGSNGVGKGATQVIQANFNANAANDGTGIPDWWKATLPAMTSGTVLRYKIGVTRTNASAVFPFSNANIDVAERMETLFDISNFNATTAKYSVHNDYSQMATGLTEGFHVLRSRAFVGRDNGSSIYKTNTQVFYYDTQSPTGMVRYPNENDTLGGSSYGAVVLTDPSVTEVSYYIDDLDSGNDSAADGNGLYAWQSATVVASPTNLGTSGYAKEWRLTYKNIPTSGIANIVVRFKEPSSSSDNSLSDAVGHFTTITRHVNTGSSINFIIGIPTGPGQTVDNNYVMKVYFKKELIPSGMTDQEFIDGFSIFISSTISGQPDNPVLQPRAGYHLVRDVNGNEHSVEFTFPNLYNGDPDFLHFVKVEYARGSLTLGDSEVVKMRADDHLDTDGDGMPDWWERKYGLETTNGTGRHGAQGDFDNDGVTNIREYLFGMNPLLDDLALVPQVTLVKHPTLANTWSLGFTSIPNRLYQWQSTTDFINWQNVGGSSNTAGAAGNGTLQRNDVQTGPKKFFRMTVLPSP